jgi:hypothetical protein
MRRLDAAAARFDGRRYGIGRRRIDRLERPDDLRPVPEVSPALRSVVVVSLDTRAGPAQHLRSAGHEPGARSSGARHALRTRRQPVELDASRMPRCGRYVHCHDRGRSLGGLPRTSTERPAALGHRPWPKSCGEPARRQLTEYDVTPQVFQRGFSSFGPTVAIGRRASSGHREHRRRLARAAYQRALLPLHPPTRCAPYTRHRVCGPHVLLVKLHAAGRDPAAPDASDNAASAR